MVAVTQAHGPASRTALITSASERATDRLLSGSARRVEVHSVDGDVTLSAISVDRREDRISQRICNPATA